jgi:excisionase family DNA binding protein
MADWMSVAEAADALGVHERQVRNLIADSQLEAQRLGRAWLVSPASVGARRRQPTVGGRPLSAPLAWYVLAHLDAAVGDALAAAREPADRRVRHRVRQLLKAPPAPEVWGSWLRRRAEPHAVWFHPGSEARLTVDGRIARADLSSELGVPVADLCRRYVAARDFSAVVADHHGRLAEGESVPGASVMMVVPGLPDDIDWTGHLDASSLVDLAGDADARVRHGALRVLSDAMPALAAAGQRSR